jgi:phosphoribosylformylglycinamidine synthase
VDAGRAAELQALARDAGVPAAVIGRVGGDRIRVAVAGRMVLDDLVTDVEPLWLNAINDYFDSKRAVA